MIRTNDIDSRIQTEFVNTNGIRLEVDKCGDQSARTLALCLHGFPEHAISWRFQMPMLADMGLKVWAPNMRGYGNSSIPPAMEDYGIEGLMEDVGGLIDAADCDEVILIAHDWGAVIAWFFAMRKIRPISKLIICNVPHPQAMRQAMGWEQLKKSWYVLFFQIPGLPEMMVGRSGGSIGQLFLESSSAPQNFSVDVLQIYDENARRPGGMTAMVNYYRALVRGGGGKRQQDLGTDIIDVPTLMIWGEDDMALTVETTHGTEKWVRDFQIRYLPRVSHWVQQDAPDEVNTMMRAFIEDKSVPYMSWQPVLTDEPADA